MLNRSTGRWVAASALVLFTPIFGTLAAVEVLKIFNRGISSGDLPVGLALVGMSVNYGAAALNWRRQEQTSWARLMQSPLVVVPTATVAVMLCAWIFNGWQIGLFAAIGLSAAAVFAGLALPLISPQLLKSTVDPHQDGKIVAVFVMALLVVSAAGIWQLRVESHNLCLLTAAGLTAILLVVAALQGRIELVVAAMAPVVFSILLSLGALGLAGIVITSSNSVFMLFLLGLSTDYSVSVLWKRLETFRGRNSGNTGAALRIISAVWVVGFMALAGLGTIGVIVIGSSLAASLLLSPAIANWLLPVESKRLAPSLTRRAVDRCYCAKSLYSYLDIDAEQYVKWKLRLDPIFSGIDSTVPQVGQILDAGCGYGQMSNTLALQSSSRTVIGVDRDERKILVAQCAARTVGNVRFVVGDLLEWEYPRVDCVLLIDVLHYWNMDKQEKIIAKAAGCLHENGTLVFREGLASSSWGHRMVHWGERWSTWTGQNRRGDGLFFQDRAFYLENFGRHGLSLEKEVPEWGPGSNSVLVMRRASGA